MKPFWTLWLSVGAGLGAPAAHAYTVRTTHGGIPLHWAEPTVPFRVDRSLGEVGNAGDVGRTVAEAFAGWGALPGSPFLFQGNPHPVGRAEAEPWDGVTDIVLVEDEWEHDATFAGVTIVTYDAASGEILDADVLLNGAELRFGLDEASCYDVGNVLTHELGHLLGLGHSEDPEATMYAVSRPGETGKRTLSADDAAGFDELYGGGVAAAGVSCAVAPRAGGSGLFAASLVTLLVVLGGRRRRRPGPPLGRRGRTAAIALGLVALVAGAPGGSAAVRRVLTVNELAARADVVFRGTVTARRARWAGRFIVTDVAIAIDECWAGDCGADGTRVVTELGGEVDGVGMLAPEPTALPVGAEAVVFVRAVRGTSVLVAGAQAVFRVDAAPAAAVRVVPRHPEEHSDAGRFERLPLSTLRAVVRSGASGP